MEDARAESPPGRPWPLDAKRRHYGTPIYSVTAFCDKIRGCICRTNPKARGGEAPVTYNNKAKLKTLYVKQILEEETDAEHGLSMRQIIERL